MSASLYPRPLPYLPLETKAHILANCDVQTLGRATQVSLAFLELAGPILYEHITVTGYNHLQRLIDGQVSKSFWSVGLMKQP